MLHENKCIVIIFIIIIFRSDILLILFSNTNRVSNFEEDSILSN